MWANTIDFLFQGHESLLGGLSSLYKFLPWMSPLGGPTLLARFVVVLGKPWALYFLGSSSVFLKIYLALYSLQKLLRVDRLTSPSPPSDRITTWCPYEGWRRSGASWLLALMQDSFEFCAKLMSLLIFIHNSLWYPQRCIVYLKEFIC